MSFLILKYMKVAIIMGSTSDWTVMSAAVETLAEFGVEIEKRVISAHRTPDLMVEFAKTAKECGIGVIIAGAGGAAHVASPERAEQPMWQGWLQALRQCL